MTPGYDECNPIHLDGSDTPFWTFTYDKIYVSLIGKSYFFVPSVLRGMS